MLEIDSVELPVPDSSPESVLKLVSSSLEDSSTGRVSNELLEERVGAVTLAETFEVRVARLCLGGSVKGPSS